MGSRRKDARSRFRVLSEYECGRAQLAIEWVARSEKPIVEVGGYAIGSCDLKTLAADLNRCIRISKESVSVKGFIVPDSLAGFCCYGFYRYPWAIEAFLFSWKARGQKLLLPVQHSQWIQGLLFGYSPEAIHRFMLSRQRGRASKSHALSCIETVRLHRVGIYGPLVSSVQIHNNPSDRSRKPC